MAYNKVLFVWHFTALAFLITTLRPLVRVAEKRVAMFIVVSKTLGSFVKLHFDLMLALVRWLNGPKVLRLSVDSPQWYQRLFLCYTQTMVFSLYGHIMMLAINRLIGIYFPFKYKDWMSKSRILIYCFSIWLLAICLTLFYVFLEYREMIAALSLVCLAVSICLYLLISLKLLSLKYFRRRNRQPIRSNRATERKEKNPVLVSIICFGSLLSGLVYLALPLFQSDMAWFPEPWRFIFEMFMIGVYDCIYCWDELCLFLLLGELRSNWLAQCKEICQTCWRLMLSALNCCCCFFGLGCWSTNWTNYCCDSERGRGRVVPHGFDNTPARSTSLCLNSNAPNSAATSALAHSGIERTVLQITLLFAAISAAFYLTFLAAMLGVQLNTTQRDPECAGTIPGYPCLLDKTGCPPSIGGLMAQQEMYWSECDLFMPWLSAKELGCRRRVYTAVSSCFQFWVVNYGSKYLCCADNLFVDGEITFAQ